MIILDTHIWVMWVLDESQLPSVHGDDPTGEPCSWCCLMKVVHFRQEYSASSYFTSRSISTAGSPASIFATLDWL